MTGTTEYTLQVLQNLVPLLINTIRHHIFICYLLYLLLNERSAIGLHILCLACTGDKKRGKRFILLSLWINCPSIHTTRVSRMFPHNMSLTNCSITCQLVLSLTQHRTYINLFAQSLSFLNKPWDVVPS